MVLNDGTDHISMHAEHAQQVGKLEKRITRRCDKPHVYSLQLHTPAAKDLLIDALVKLLSYGTESWLLQLRPVPRTCCVASDPQL